MTATNGQITKWYAAAVKTEASGAAIGAMHRATLVVESYVKQNFTVPGHGRLYKRGKNVHRASAPGEPPSVDTGTLRASISREVVVGASEVNGYVGVMKNMRQRGRRRQAAARTPRRAAGAMTTVSAGPDYGLYLEKGTRRMGARPYLVPALRALRVKINAIFRGAFS